MSSRRYYTAVLPVEHINGKMAPQRVKCPNTDDPEAVEVSGFWYGYKHRATPNVSRFGVRTLCRDLTAKPYTAAEDENRTLFTASLYAVYDHKTIASKWAKCLADFERQDRYKTPIGFAVAACRANGGEWLPEWE